MTKLQLLLTSLIAVIPGGLLIFLLVTAMLQYSDKMSMIAYVIVGGTLLCMVVTVLMPLGILFGGGRKPAAATIDTKKKASDESESLNDDIELAAEPSDSMESIELSDSMDGEIEDSFDGSSESDLHIATSEFDLGDSFNAMDAIDDESMIGTDPVEDFDSLEIDGNDFEEVEELEEEPKPKKKKR